MRIRIAMAMLGAALVAACATDPSAMQTSALPQGAVAGVETPVRGTPVVPGRPARMYVMVGFKEADCSPLAPSLQVTSPPAKGEVSFRPNQETTVMQSNSGKCTGGKLPGTGIYYTARPGASGTDTFTVSASSGNGPPSVRTFTVRIAD